MVIANLLASTSFIIANKCLIKRIGLAEAILIGELCSQYNYWRAKKGLEGDWFYSTVSNVEEETGIKRTTQTTILTRLKGLGLLDFKKMGMPPKRYVKLDFAKIGLMLDDSSVDEEPNVGQCPTKGLSKVEPKCGQHNNNKNKKENKNNIILSLENAISICEKEGLSGMSENPRAFAEWFWKVSHNEDGSLNYKGKEIKNWGGLVSVLRGIDLNGKKFKKAKGSYKPRIDESYL
jgi:hypothetical protein